MDTIKNESDNHPTKLRGEKNRKELYRTPSLICLGKVTNLTAGSAPGKNESNNPSIFRFDP